MALRLDTVLAGVQVRESDGGKRYALAIHYSNGSIEGLKDARSVVTVFDPDTERNGIPYDYAEELLSNPDNIELKIERGLSERSATGEKHPNTSSELPSKDSIPQKQDLSTPAVKKHDLGGKPSRKTAEKKETGEKFDEHFARAEIRAYEREAKEAQNTAEAFKAGNRILTRKLEASRAEAARYRAEGMSLARK